MFHIAIRKLSSVQYQHRKLTSLFVHPLQFSSTGEGLVEYASRRKHGGGLLATYSSN